jgi:hypothetical protein
MNRLVPSVSLLRRERLIKAIEVGPFVGIVLTRSHPSGPSSSNARRAEETGRECDVQLNLGCVDKSFGEDSLAKRRWRCRLAKRRWWCRTTHSRPAPAAATIPARSRAGSDIGRSPAPPSTRRWRRTGSRTSGEIRMGGTQVDRRSGHPSDPAAWHTFCFEVLRPAHRLGVGPSNLLALVPSPLGCSSHVGCLPASPMQMWETACARLFGLLG